MLFKPVEESLKKGEADDMDSALFEALVESYKNSNHWSTRRQILSLYVIIVCFMVEGAEVLRRKNTRIYVAPEKLDNFLTFITSSAVVQDMPFGERTEKLS